MVKMGSIKNLRIEFFVCLGHGGLKSLDRDDKNFVIKFLLKFQFISFYK